MSLKLISIIVLILEMVLIVSANAQYCLLNDQGYTVTCGQFLDACHGDMMRCHEMPTYQEMQAPVINPNAYYVPSYPQYQPQNFAIGFLQGLNTTIQQAPVYPQ
jgi:hypothetical protein